MSLICCEKNKVYCKMDREEEWSKKGRKQMWVVSQGFFEDRGIKKKERRGVLS